MHTSQDRPSTHQQALDWLFSRLGGQSAPEYLVAEEPVDMPAASAPEIRTPEDLKLANEWIGRERRRLEAYTRGQLERIQQEHQALLKQTYLTEQSLILRSQQLTRKEELLLSRGQAIQQDAQDLAQREQALANMLHQYYQADQNLANIQAETREAERQRALAETLLSETRAMQQAREDARAELEGLLSATKEHRETRTKEEVAMKARQEQLEQRLLAAEKALLAADQRQAEMDDYETRLRAEVEEQERELSLQRQVTEALSQKLKAEWHQRHQETFTEDAAEELEYTLRQPHRGALPAQPPSGRRSDSHPGTTRFDRHMGM